MIRHIMLMETQERQCRQIKAAQFNGYSGGIKVIGKLQCEGGNQVNSNECLCLPRYCYTKDTPEIAPLRVMTLRTNIILRH